MRRRELLPKAANRPVPRGEGTWQTLGLESAALFPANKGHVLSRHGIDRAYRMMSRGFSLTSDVPLAEKKQTVKVNMEILSHWKEKNKSVKDENYRMEVFLEAMRTLKYPEEIWEQPNGVRVYFRAVVIQGNKNFITGVVVDRSNTAVSFIRTKSHSYTNNKRKGKLLYKRNAE